MPKNIVVCTDGTWNKPDQQDRGRVVPSNIVKIARTVSDKSKDGSREQIYYYDTGVGTGNFFNKAIGGITGAGLVLNTKQAYSFICQHYQPGDKLFIFGFSRGAYTARYLAGLVGRIGIRKDVKDISRTARIGKIEQAFEMSRTWRGKKKPMPDDVRKQFEDFRTNNCYDEREVHFLGVWDTVGALGVPVKLLGRIGRSRFKFIDVKLGTHVSHAYHALAVDEKRKNFVPTLWDVDAELPDGHTLEQVWFPGVHSNVGGGYVDTGLSDRALLWMTLKAEKYGLGIDGRYIAHRADPNYHGELRDSSGGVWKLLGKNGRDVCGAKGVNQYVHFSSEARSRHTTNSYWPKNLMPVLGRDPKPIAAIEPPEKQSSYFAEYASVGSPTGYEPESWNPKD